MTPSIVSDLEPVCAALGKPILYTSNAAKKGQGYYVEGKVAPQLAKKNRTGINLNCPAYKR